LDCDRALGGGGPESRDHMLLRSAILAGVAAVAAGSLLRARTKARASLQATPYVGSDKKRCLLISNSKLSGLEYLDHVLDHIRNFLGDDAADATVVFVPYAQRDRDAYADKFRKAFAPISSNVVSLHECEDLRARRSAVRDARAIFVGGGNTFRLLKCLQDDAELMPLIASRVASGELAYIGSSAGSNVACPTIRNTNVREVARPNARARRSAFATCARAVATR
jgi:cyanophycinase-like exopeptidase